MFVMKVAETTEIEYGKYRVTLTRMEGKKRWAYKVTLNNEVICECVGVAVFSKDGAEKYGKQSADSHRTKKWSKA